MSVQTPYLNNPNLSFPGTFGADDPTNVRRGKDAEHAIAFGYGIVQGTAADQADIPAGATDTNFLGVAMRDLGATDVDTDAYAANDAVAYAPHGMPVVAVNQDVTEGAVVHLYHTAGSDTTMVPGQFSDAAEASKTFTVNGAKFKQTVSGGTGAAPKGAMIDLAPGATLTADT